MELRSRGYILTASCPSRSGVVHAVSRFIERRGCSLDEHQQFDDPATGRFFMRTEFSGALEADPSALVEDLVREEAAGMGLDVEVAEAAARPRIGVLVSREGHCLNDLIFRWRSHDLGGDLVVVASNHRLLEPMAEAAGLPFVHIPVAPDTKPEAEQALRDLTARMGVDLLVLARYMQVLSDDIATELRGRVINIHHSFLPGFKGARPYHQAHARGVKYVGATAHYVTGDLDEGPIIEQEVIRVTHAADAAELARIGRDAEALALSRAVRWHCQRRVLLNGNRTVVFS